MSLCDVFEQIHLGKTAGQRSLVMDVILYFY
jgi:hypothetical protein